jgi:hypothetical protein
VAGVVLGVQGLAGLAFTVAVLTRIAAPDGQVSQVVAEAVWFGLTGVAVLAVGVLLVRGVRGARTPAVVVQLLLAGVAWYAAGPSGQPAYGVPVGVVCVLALVLLLGAPARRWAWGEEGARGHRGSDAP